MSTGIPKMVPKKPPIPSGRALQYAFSEKNRNGEITFFLNYFARIYCKEHFFVSSSNSRTMDSWWLDPKFCTTQIYTTLTKHENIYKRINKIPQSQIENPEKCIKILAFHRKKWRNNVKSQTRDTQWQNLSQKYPKIPQNLISWSAQLAKISGIFQKNPWVSAVRGQIGLNFACLSWILNSEIIVKLTVKKLATFHFT